MKTKALISFAVTAKLICVFVFAYADCWFFHVAAQLLHRSPILQNHWFTYNEKMAVESVTQAVSNLALQFGDDKAESGSMVGSNSYLYDVKK